MQIIETNISDDLIFAALGFSEFRKKVKNFLSTNHQEYDKFTTTENDSYLGYIAEYLVKKYIMNKFGRNGLMVNTWNDLYDLTKIEKIIKKDNPSNEDIVYVKEYFYDKYDLVLKTSTKEVYIDVKTAETEREPNKSWNFLYPVVQNEKAGKDYAVLGYYIKNTKELTDFQKFVLCGYISEEQIRKCPIQPKSTTTNKGTLSQIDNYKTLLVDYKPLDELIYNLLLEETQTKNK